MTSELAIGIVETSQGGVQAMRSNGLSVELHAGVEIFPGDCIETGDAGIVGISFIDGSGFSLGARGEAIVERYVYDRPSGTGECFLSVATGCFGVSPGRIGLTNADAMTIVTPVAAISVSGARVIGQAGPEGSDNSFTLVKDDSSFGQVVVHNESNARLLDRDGQTVVIGFRADGVPDPVVLPGGLSAMKYAAVNAALPAGLMEQAGTSEMLPDRAVMNPDDALELPSDPDVISLEQVIAVFREFASDGRIPVDDPDNRVELPEAGYRIG